MSAKGEKNCRFFHLLRFLRARELCTLTRAQVRLGKRSGTLSVIGKPNKHREIPLNATARSALLAYDPLLCKPSQDMTPLFLSKKKHTRLSERGSGYVIKKYAEKAQVRDVSPHDLRHRFGYRMATTVPLHRLAQLMGYDSLDTTMIYVQATKKDLQRPIRPAHERDNEKLTLGVKKCMKKQKARATRHSATVLGRWEKKEASS